MSTITWDSVGDRTYETGLDRGVLYDPEGIGVAWNGLTSIDETTDDAVEPVYYDAQKINDIVTKGNFSGVLRAFTYPDEFLRFEGILEDQLGVFLSEQMQRRFHLSYRTRIASDTSEEVGYKLHLLYNLTAIPETKVRRTLGLAPEPNEFSWSLTAIPEDIAGFRPTSHLIFDSRRLDPWLLLDIESILYGDETNSPTMPDMQGLITFIRKWDRLIIEDNNDGTWTVISQDDSLFTEISETEFEFDADNVTYLDVDTYEVSSSDKNEEDV